MADSTKYVPIGNGGNSITLDIKNLFSILKTRRTVTFAYAFMLIFICFTLFLAFSPSPNTSSPWFTNIFSSSTSTDSSSSPSKSQFASLYSFFFPNTTTSSDPLQSNISRSSNVTSENSVFNSTKDANTTSVEDNSVFNSTKDVNTTSVEDNSAFNSTQHASVSVDSTTNHTAISNTTSQVVKNETLGIQNRTDEAKTINSNAIAIAPSNNVSVVSPPPPPPPPPPQIVPVLETHKNLSSNSSVKSDSVKTVASNNYTASLARKQKKKDELMESLMKCDFFDGEWIKDDSYPLYKPGSCSIIDEQFNCIANGRPDKGYQKYKWKPKGCSLPRLDGHRMLDLLRGKRLVFVGDSLNRNMWESLICILRNSVKNKHRVYEANGRVHFRGEASYSFIFKDYNFSVELFVSPFLVQEWEVSDKNGTKKETLRLDLVGGSSSQYKDADIIVFNTGHWWTHDKTSKGEDYYQEGNHVYHELNVLEAFRKAITTWSRWVDANINPSKSIVLFRGYSASHFSGGQWNSGGQCDNETVPIDNEKYLNEYPSKMRVLESVLKYMKTPVSYMNITRMTDFRKDGHPSVYRKQNLSPEERKSPLRYQDCSHWCLPGVPDAWNEILYAELLMREYRNHHQQKKA